MNKINIILLGSALLLTGCPYMPVVEQEIERITSPGGRVDAVHVTRDAGATTSVGHHIFIVPKGSKVDESVQAVFIADHPEDLHLEWRGDKHLAISYSKARVFAFRNFWNDQALENFQYELKITETEHAGGG